MPVNLLQPTVQLNLLDPEKKIIQDSKPIKVITAYSPGPPGGPGVQGPKGDKGDQGIPGNGAALTFSFSWGDISPIALFNSTEGLVIRRTEIIVLNEFDGEAYLSLGYSTDHGCIMPSTEIDLRTKGTYQSNPSFIINGQIDVCYYLNLAGDVSTGNGLILFYNQE